MFEPSKYKHRKAFKGRLSGNSNRNNSLSFGSFGLKSLEHYRLNSKQLEAIRKVAMKFIKNKGKLWFNVFPNVPVSKKPADVRMGKGKGSLEFWIARIQPGRIILEIEGISDANASIIMQAIKYKLPFDCKVVKSEIGGFR